MHAGDRKCSRSMSSRLTLTPNSVSNCNSMFTNTSESTAPLASRSVSGSWTGRPSVCSNRCITLSKVGASGIIVALLLLSVFVGQQVEPETVVDLAIDVMAVALPADGPEVEAPERAQGSVVALHRPSVHAIQ